MEYSTVCTLSPREWTSAENLLASVTMFAWREVWRAYIISLRAVSMIGWPTVGKAANGDVPREMGSRGLLELPGCGALSALSILIFDLAGLVQEGLEGADAKGERVPDSRGSAEAASSGRSV